MKHCASRTKRNRSELGAQRPGQSSYVIDSNMSPVVSIIIPWHNTPLALLHRALRSARSQTCSFPFEVVLVDDGSDRDLDDIVVAQTSGHEGSSAHLTIRRLPDRKGVGAARNAGIQVASGRYVVWLDADDELMPSTLQVLWEESQQTKAPIVLGDCLVKTGNRGQVRRHSALYLRELSRRFEGTLFDPFATTVFAIQPQLIDISVLREVGGFSPSYDFAELTDLFLRCVSAVGRTAIRHVPEPLYRYYRTNPKAISVQHRHILELYRRTALAEFARRQGLPNSDLSYLGREWFTGAQHYAPVVRHSRCFPPYISLLSNGVTDEPKVQINLKTTGSKQPR